MTTQTALRPELEPLPRRMRFLPVDDRGYVVPWFVAWIEGKPEFRAMDPEKFVRAIREKRCWVCGDTLGKRLAFVIGPMCGVNRNTSEPACHLECAGWSARNCPFLSRPHAKRREDELTEEFEKHVAGYAIKRNPGVTCIWVTESFTLYEDGNGRPLIEIGEPTSVRWYAEGRLATRAEVQASIDSGLPLLREKAEEQAHLGAPAALEQMVARLQPFLPAE